MIVLLSMNENHNHELYGVNAQMNQEMIEELTNYESNQKINELTNILEKKFKVRLSYGEVYRAFRKIHPKFGPDDVKVLLNSLV